MVEGPIPFHDLSRGTTTDAARTVVAPKSIAIIGASSKPAIARRLIALLERIGFADGIFPGNSNYSTVDSMRDGTRERVLQWREPRVNPTVARPGSGCATWPQ